MSQYGRIREIFDNLNTLVNTDIDIELLEDTNIINAWIKGQEITITEPLANMLDDDELAFVIAHEICHYMRRHSYRKYRVSTFFASIIGGVLTDKRHDFWSRALIAGLWIGGDLVVGRFISRLHEYESDDMAYQLMSDAGYDANNAAGFFYKLGPGGGGILSTHPSHSRRVRRLAGQHNHNYSYDLPEDDLEEQEDQSEPEEQEKSEPEDEVCCYNCSDPIVPRQTIWVCADCREDFCDECWSEGDNEYCADCAWRHENDDPEEDYYFCDWCKDDIDRQNDDVIYCPDCQNMFCDECWSEGSNGYCSRCAKFHQDEQHDECSDCECEISEDDFFRICPECQEDFCQDCWSEGEEVKCQYCSPEDEDDEDDDPEDDDQGDDPEDDDQGDDD